MAYLYRTADWSSSNSTSCVMSMWVKLANPQSTQMGFFLGWGDANNYGTMYLNNDDHIYYKEKNGGTQYEEQIDARKFRDHNAWYHFFLQWDYTQATASNRLKIYVNNELMTWSNSGNSLPPQNYSTRLKKNDFRIGTYTHAGSSYSDWKGLMSHVHFIDDASYDTYTPSTFGSTDSTTGEWKINTSPTISDYGSQGFFILKDNNSGTDQSGKGNNFSTNGTITKTEDNPSNVFATLNPLHYSLNTSRAFSNGNTYVALGGTARVPEVSTIGMTSGKFYAEMKDISGSGGGSIMGITGQMRRASAVDYLGSKIYDYAYYSASGDKINDANETSFGNSYTDGDIIGVAVDLDNLKIYFSKNGTWQNSGDPTSGSTGTGAAFTLAAPSSTIDGAYFFACSDDNQYAERRMAWNFGNGYFQTTAVSSAGTNASNIGIFEYDVPTGYTALSTKGLNE